MDWARDLPNWPLSHLSRRVICRPHQWHVQEDGTGDTLLLIHGAGGSAHSWRDILPRLAQSFHVVALDLPGQGFTRPGSKGRYSLPLMSQDILSLCAAEKWRPRAIIGHSAGAALALSLADHSARERGESPAVLGINAALGRFDGVASWLFPLLAKVLALNPLTAPVFVMGRGHPARARRLIDSTGSTLTEEGYALYGRLIADRVHVDGTLQMMAQWNTDALNDRLGAIEARCLLIGCDNDKAVSPRISSEAATRLGDAEYLHLPDLGHLAHEENPDLLARVILKWLGDL